MNSINNVDLNLLKALRALLAERHVGKAAKIMSISQSAMSHTLSRLRNTFDDPLFVRTYRGLEPTVRALQIGEQLEELMMQLEALLAPQIFDPANAKARICLQTHDFIAAAYLPRFLENIRILAPGVIFDLKMPASDAYEQLDNGNIDLIIGIGHRANPGFMQRSLCLESLVCLLDKQHPALKQWSAEAIFNYPHVKLSLLDEKQDPVSQYAKRHGIGDRQIGIYTQTLHMQPYVIKNTDNIAFVPLSVARQGEKLFDLEIQPCPFELPDIDIKVIWHQRNQQDPLHQWIREQLVACIGEQ